MKYAGFDKAAAIGLMEGEFIDRPATAAVLIKRSRTLVITFSNIGCFKFSSKERLPWLHRRVEDNGASMLGLMTKDKDWYRNADAAGILADLHKVGWFNDFDRILMMGASMGGFAALTHCDLVPNTEVMAFSPQSTLAPDLVPFETRFERKQKAFDWTSQPRLDAADTSHFARKAWILYDPQVKEDHLHINRLPQDNIERIRCRDMGHTLPNSLKRAGVLDSVIQSAIDGSFNAPAFYRTFRDGRRKMVGILRAKAETCMAKNQFARAEAICRIARQNGGGPYFRRTLSAIAGKKAA